MSLVSSLLMSILVSFTTKLVTTRRQASITNLPWDTQSKWVLLLDSLWPSVTLVRSEETRFMHRWIKIRCKCSLRGTSSSQVSLNTKRENQVLSCNLVKSWLRRETTIRPLSTSIEPWKSPKIIMMVTWRTRPKSTLVWLTPPLNGVTMLQVSSSKLKTNKMQWIKPTMRELMKKKMRIK